MNEEEGHLRKFQKELNAGIVALVLLATLDEAREPQYGYQIAKQLERDNEENAVMKQGTLYPVLRSLSAVVSVFKTVLTRVIGTELPVVQAACFWFAARLA